MSAAPVDDSPDVRGDAAAPARPTAQRAVSAQPRPTQEALALLGYRVEPDPWPQAPAEQWQVRSESGEVLAHGTRPYCERIRLDHLRGLYGDGSALVRWPTLGGRQLWADEFIYRRWRVQHLVGTDLYRLLDPSDRQAAAGSWEACRVAFEQLRLEQGIQRRSSHAVVLLHGLGRSKEAMTPLAKAFGQAGYEVLNVNYPSTRGSVREHAAQVARLMNRCQDLDAASFVTHSMGGIVARMLLGPDPPAPAQWRARVALGRLLMIFPPSQGARAAAEWKGNPVARSILGPPLAELTPDNAERIPMPQTRYAVIAGARDRRVSPEEAELPGAEAVRVMDVEHTFGMRQPEVINAALRYINGGKLI